MKGGGCYYRPPRALPKDSNADIPKVNSIGLQRLRRNSSHDRRSAGFQAATLLITQEPARCRRYEKRRNRVFPQPLQAGVCTSMSSSHTARTRGYMRARHFEGSASRQASGVQNQ